MKILVTGGAGFIGSHLVDKLIELNHDVYIIDNLSSGTMYNLQPKYRLSERLFRVNISNKHSVKAVFTLVKPDIVYHLAAQINVRKSIDNPEEDAENNILGTLNILSQCISHGVKKMIFSSSGGAVYQECKEPIRSENSPINPISPYGISKYTAEQYINFYKNIYNLDNTIFRFSNVYGPRQNSRGEAGVVSIFIDRLANNESLKVFGDGEQKRDYVYVQDVVDALVLGLNITGIYNVSTGEATSVNKLISILNKHIACNNVVYEPPIPGEMNYNCLSNRSLKCTGWSPKYSLEKGIKETIEWMQNK